MAYLIGHELFDPYDTAPNFVACLVKNWQYDTAPNFVVDQLSINRHNLKMTDVSKLVSNHWKNEPELVKNAYRDIAREVKVELGKKCKASSTYRIVWKNSNFDPYDTAPNFATCDYIK